ncbi:hypothetical protein ASF16_20305 [Acidovorax sp. Leaf78]|nr:hypothetical protein ASF16_20305 [Acidovorax sp. Leaf78]
MHHLRQYCLRIFAKLGAGKDGQPQSQVFSYQYDALDRRIAKTDSFGTTAFTWEGMRLLQESRGAQTSTYIYEPGSYVPLARILGGDAEQGKQGSVPTTNPQWADRFNVAAAANDEPGGSSTPNVREGAGGEDIAQVYYFHTQPNGLPEELSDNSGNLVWRAQYTTWGSTVREEWQSFDTAGRPQQQPGKKTQGDIPGECGGQPVGGFYAINALNKVGCTNMAVSEYYISNFDLNNPQYDFDYQVLYDEMGGLDIAICAEMPRELVVSKTLVDKIKINKIKGFVLYSTLDMTMKNRSIFLNI